MTDDAPPLPGTDPGPGADADGRKRHVTCALCGAPLRDRTSRLWGLGRDCRRKLHLRAAPAPPVTEVDQETLPGL